ncbi:MAG: hypothetical protein OEX04_12615 [Acidimicrobiia bacterium]|nr:hypothetical protein [Acidimicrobiia bacterium]MDH4308311.1 hypothetical protein [Acidimicrobiia bacterium]
MVESSRRLSGPGPLRRLGVVLTTAIVMLGLNSLWYAVLMKGFYDRDTGSWGAVARENPSMVFILLSFVTLATLMTVAYPYVSFGRSWWARGLGLGIMSGLVFIVPAGFYYFGTTDILVGEVLAADIGWHLIEESAAGLTIAALLGRPAAVSGSGVPDLAEVTR